MTTLINADTVVGGAVITADASGELALQAAGATKLTVGSSGVTLASALPVASGGTGATSLTANNVLLGNDTSQVQLVAPGSNGNILTSNGTTWTSAAPAGGATWVFLTSANFPGNTSEIDITGVFSSTYDTYWILYQNVISTNFNFRLNYGSGFLTSDYGYGATSQQINGASGSSYGGMNFSRIPVSSLSRYSVVNVYVYNRNGSFNKTIAWDAVGVAADSTSGYWIKGIGGQNNNTGAITGVRITGDGNFTQGSYFVYGLKKS